MRKGTYLVQTYPWPAEVELKMGHFSTVWSRIHPCDLSLKSANSQVTSGTSIKVQKGNEK